jgi:DNA invertase Pin-like site-specific DNA recombinase
VQITFGRKTGAVWTSLLGSKSSSWVGTSRHRDEHSIRRRGRSREEACAAFILSQKREGWTVLPALYDDGGVSGGTMERPALKRLIADIEAGQIDVVVACAAAR